MGNSLVRHLYSGPSEIAPSTYTWDGRDRDGASLPAGLYQVSSFSTSPITCNLLCTLGVNGNPIWKKAVGNQNAVGCVAVNGSSIALFPGQSEVSAGYAVIDTTGKYLYVYYGFAIGGFSTINTGLDGAAGFSAGFDGINYFLLALNTRVASVNATTYSPNGTFPWPNVNPGGPRDWNNGGWIELQDLSAHPTVNNVFVCTFADQNLIQFFNATNPINPTVTHSWTVSSPTGVALLASGDALFISGGAVKKIIATTGVVTTVIAAGAPLDNPIRLAVDPASGIIWIANRGASHQVLKYSADGSTLLKTYGVYGGRVDGPYDPASFTQVIDIEAHPGNGFWVTEKYVPPRSTRHINDDGTVAQQYFGGQAYGYSCSPEPLDPTKIWQVQNPGYVRYSLDYTTGAWSVLECYWNNVPLGSGQSVQVVQRNGFTYFCENGAAAPAVWIRTGNTVRKCAYLSFAGNQITLNADTNLDGSFPFTSSWTQTSIYYLGNATFDNDLSFYQSFNLPGFRLQCTGVALNGVPSWDVAGRTTFPAVTWDGRMWPQYVSCYKDTDGSFYALVQDTVPSTSLGTGISGGIYYQDILTWETALVKFSSTGQQSWASGSHSVDWNTPPSGLTYPWRIAGIVGNFVFVTHFTDSDSGGLLAIYDKNTGAWIGQAFGPSGIAGQPYDASFYPQGNDNFIAQVLPHPFDRTKAVAYCQGLWSSPIYAIALPTVTVGSSPFFISSPLALQSGTGLTVTYYNSPDLSGVPLQSGTAAPFVVTTPWPPVAGVTGTYFSLTMTGQYLHDSQDAVRFVVYPASGSNYNLNLVQVKLTVGGTVVIDSANNIGWEILNQLKRLGRSDPVALQPNVWYSIAVEIRYVPAVAAPFNDVDAADKMIGLAWEEWPARGRGMVPASRCLPATGGMSLAPGAFPAWPSRPTRAYGELIARWLLSAASQLNANQYAANVPSTAVLNSVNGVSQTDHVSLTGGPVWATAHLWAWIDYHLHAPGDNSQKGEAIEFWFRTTNYNAQLFAFRRMGLFYHDADYSNVTLNGNTLTIYDASDQWIITNIGGTWTDGAWHHFIFSRGPQYGYQVKIDDLPWLTRVWDSPPSDSIPNTIRIGPQESAYSIDIKDARSYSGEFLDPIPTPITPASVASVDQNFRADLSCYKDVAMTQPCTADGDLILALKDLSGAGNHATTTAGHEATYKINVLNGHPVIRFNGSTSYFSIPALTVGSMYVVCNFTKAATFTNFETLYILAASTDLSQPPWHGSGAPGPYPVWRGFGTPYSWRMRSGGPPPVVGSNDGIFPSAYTYVDGLQTTVLGSTVPNVPLSAFHLSYGLIQGGYVPAAFDQAGTLGADPANPGREWGGDVAEIVVSSALLADDLPTHLGLTTYFQARYKTP